MYAQVARYCNRSADLIPLSFVLGKFKEPGVLPCSLLTIFPYLWVGLLALRVRITPAEPLGGQPEQAQQAWELRAGSRISRGLGPAYHVLDPHSKQGPSHLLASQPCGYWRRTGER